MRNIFTFDAEHAHPNGYVIVYGTDKRSCREKIKDAYGDKWSMQYPDEKAAGVEERGLELVAVL